ncbi:Serine/threonine-protein kinase PknK [compost metagenome]
MKKKSDTGFTACQLARPRLIAQLEGGGSARLVLICAAAGFGKTTLLRQYREHCIAARRQVLWLSLDERDNDLAHFVVRLGHEFAVLGIPAGTDADAAGAADRLLEQLAGYRQPMAILLDRFEVIRSAALLDFVQQMLAMSAPGLCVAIASRNTPTIGLGRLRAHGQMLEIKPTALHFNLKETAELLRGNYRLTVCDADIAALHRATEGWAVALDQAASSLAGDLDANALIESFSTGDPRLATFLCREIYQQQRPDCRQFLVQTSVLEQLCAPLCDTLTGRQDSEDMIEHLLRANLLLATGDKEQRGYRHHRLFGQFLRETLHRQHPAQVGTLYRNAARWYLAARQPIPAIDCLLDAGDTLDAVGVLSANLNHVLRNGRTRLLLRWRARMPTDVLVQYPDVCLVIAWALILSRQFHGVQPLLENARASLEADIIQLMQLMTTDRVEAGYALGLGLLKRLSVDDSLRYGLAAYTLAFCMLATGRHDDARRLLLQATSSDPESGASFLGDVAICAESLLDLVQGRLDSAHVRLRAYTRHHWQSGTGQIFGGSVILDTVRCTVLYEADALAEAEPILTKCIAYAAVSAASDTLISTYILLARIHGINARRTDWERVLGELEAIGQQSGSERAVCSAWLERARVATLEGRFKDATRALHQVECHSAWERPGIFLYSNDVDTPEIARLRLRIHQGQHGLVVEALNQAIERAQCQQLLRRALKLRLLLALALDGLGRQNEAFAELAKALSFASHEGFMRTFLDEGQCLCDLLQRWALNFQSGSDHPDIAPDYLRDLIKRSSRQPVATALSERERQVLGLSADGLAIAAIASTLALSQNTVKTHIRNINLKLGAHSRTAGTAIARARGLID